MLECLESFEGSYPCIEVGVKQFDEIRVFRTVWNCLVGEEMVSPSTHLHDDRFSQGVSFTAVREDVVKSVIECSNVLILLKDM